MNTPEAAQDALAAAMQKFQDETYLDESHHRYHCGGSEAGRLWPYLEHALHDAGWVLTPVAPEVPPPGNRFRAIAAVAVILDEADHFATRDRLNRPSVAEETLDRLTADLSEHATALGTYLRLAATRTPEPPDSAGLLDALNTILPDLCTKDYNRLDAAISSWQRLRSGSPAPEGGE